MSKYLTRKQVAERYPISFSHLAHMASQGRGIRYRIIGKSAIYHVDDVEAWLESKVIEPMRDRTFRNRSRTRKHLSSRPV